LGDMVFAALAPDGWVYLSINIILSLPFGPAQKSRRASGYPAN
jgi:hypothetical protein